MIDIHCHILPDIDDGPDYLDEAVEMAKIASLDGITTIVATPHIKDVLHPAALIQGKVDELNKRLKNKGIPLEILRGADISSVIAPAFLKDYTINGTGYLLLEFPHTHLPGNAREMIFKIIINGFLPIITHPERNPSIIKKPGIILDLIDSNTFIQITAGSLVGDFGSEVRHCAIHLLKLGVVNFIATDAHSSSWRKPVLSEGLRVAEKIVGADTAYRLVMTNPESVIKGKPLNVS